MSNPVISKAGDVTIPLHAATGQPRTLREIEAAITQAECAFVFTGLALTAIRDGKLYRETGHKNFEKYCKNRWGFSRQRAYQLIDAAALAMHLTTFVDIAPPANESQIRPLVGRPLDEAVEIWMLANEMAAGAPVTGSLVKKAIKTLFPADPKPEVTEAEMFERILRAWACLIECYRDTDQVYLDPVDRSRLSFAMKELVDLAIKAGFWPHEADGNSTAEFRNEATQESDPLGYPDESEFGPTEVFLS